MPLQKKIVRSNTLIWKTNVLVWAKKIFTGDGNNNDNNIICIYVSRI